MEKSLAKQMFIRLLVLALVSIVFVVLCFIIGSSSTFTAILTTILLLVMAFVLLFYWVITIQELFRHLFDKEKEKFDYFYLINTLFIMVVLVLYLIFYFQLLGGAFIELLF